MTLSDNKLNIAVVGGSISGCTAAIELLRAGHHVTVVERSPGKLAGRGAGIGTTVRVMREMMARDLIDGSMPFFHVERLPHIGVDSGGDPCGFTAWVVPMAIELLNWGDLYRNLRRRVPDEIYHSAMEVTAAENLPNSMVRLTYANGSQAEYDLVLFADGYRSLGRQILFPHKTLDYRGYVLWRGVMPESELADTAPLEGNLARLSHSEGHAVCYFVPGPAGETAPGSRTVNWGMYVQVAEGELDEFLTDRTSRVRDGSLPPGSMRPALELRLKRQAQAVLPAYFGDIIEASQDTFAQAIYMVELDAYHDGRIGLIGDAGSVAPPYTASGVFKGMNNAIDLTAALNQSADVDAALAEWGAAQTRTGKQMAALGRQLEQALVFNVPDFAAMDAAGMRRWWESAARMPEELFATTG